MGNELQKQRIKKIVLTVLLLVWMIVIFLFSAQDATQSSNTSQGICYRLASVVVPGFSEMATTQQVAIVEKFQYPVRKCGHASEYAILGVILFFTISAYVENKGRFYKIVACATLGAAVYAMTDEFHQLFVPGRSCEFIDVCIDTCGALLGIVIVSVFRRIIRNVRGHE